MPMRFGVGLSCAPGGAYSSPSLVSPQARPSLDRPVRALQDGLRNRDTQRAGGLQVDDQFHVARLLDRYLARRNALQDPVDVVCDAPERLSSTGRVNQQTADLGETLVAIYRRQRVLR